MNHEDYQKAAKHWQAIDAKSKKMERERLLSEVLTFIQSHNTCALATGTDTFVRCTPLEYVYHHDAFWIFTEGGEKFIALEKNKNVCLAIYQAYENFASIKGMQVMGVAEVIEPFSEEYVAAVEAKKIPLEAFKRLPEPMNLLKITPTRIDFLNSDFKKNGFSSRQEIVFPSK
jgi:uncharacterized protein YhbP (UPF0306 family)